MSPFQPASAASVAAFVAILVAVAGTFLFGVWRAWGPDPTVARRALFRAAGALAAWLGTVCIAVGSGWLQSLPMSGLPVFFGAILAVSISAALSPVGTRLATLPMPALVGFQSFRLPLELVLHDWAAQGTIPDSMTWTGANLDVLSGVVALLAAPLADRSQTAAWIANGIGGLLLFNVMRVALLSAPVPFGWHLERPLMVAFHLPYALIAPVCVGGALIGHIVLTRALLRRR